MYGEPLELLYRTGRTGISGVEWVARNYFGSRVTVWLPADQEETPDA